MILFHNITKRLIVKLENGQEFVPLKEKMLLFTTTSSSNTISTNLTILLFVVGTRLNLVDNTFKNVIHKLLKFWMVFAMQRIPMTLQYW